MSNNSALSMLRVMFSGKDALRLGGVCGMSILAAFVETIGVASVLPFMALVIDPDALDRFPLIKDTAEAVGVSTPRGQLLLLGGAMVFIVAFGNAISAANIFIQQKFSATTGTRLADRMFSGYLFQPYAFHVKRDVASIIKVILGDINSVVSAVVSPLIIGFGKAAVALGIVTLLFLHDPVLAISVAATLVIAYVAVFQLVREKQRRLGEETNEQNLAIRRIALEGLYGIKELQVLGRQRYPIERFRQAYWHASWAQAINTVVAQVPRYVLETLAIGGILVVTLVLVARSDGAGHEVVPLLALYAFAGYRLLPSLQQLFASAISVRFYFPILGAVYSDYMELMCAPPAHAAQKTLGHEIGFKEEIRFDRVEFQYPGAERRALSGIDIVIRPNESIGLVGRTGAGKTTLADLILGLYEPTAGTIKIDGVELGKENIESWQRAVGFVSQHVFLANASIAENVAFAMPPGEIDEYAVRRALARAQASEFINALPDDINTVIGERGIKLSGGQRQRIGIARALYNEPEVLVFDEATSALDGLTEDAVMDAIKSLSGERTVILIAHRLRTVEACDRIIMLEDGRVIADGGYDALLSSSEEFRKLANPKSA